MGFDSMSDSTNQREMPTPILLYADHKAKSQEAERMLREAQILFEKTQSRYVTAPCVFAPEGKFNGIDAIRAFVHLRLADILG